jgi:hypothetical protein
MADVLQVTGLVVAAAGLWMLFPPVGVIFAGASLVLIGLSLERRAQ